MCGDPLCHPHSLGGGGFLSDKLLWPRDHVAKEPGDAERHERTLPGYFDLVTWYLKYLEAECYYMELCPPCEDF